MNSRKLSSGWKAVSLIAVTVLIAQCNSGSDSGDQRQVARFVGDFTGILSEDDTLPANGRVEALDVDGQPVELVVQPETVSNKGYGTYWVVDGQWGYELRNDHEAVQSLDVGQVLEDTFPVKARDRSARMVTIRIDGAEDAPLVTGDEKGIVARGRWTTVQGHLSIRDVDATDNPVGFDDVSAAQGSAGLGSFELQDGTWAYHLDIGHPALDSLETGESLIDSYVFRASDGSSFKVEVSVYSVAPPNVVVIMADDLGFADVGFNGSQDIPTPNIDSIAANGIHFVQGTTSHSSCSPTRAGFLTGRYQHRFGHLFNPEYAPNDPTYGLPLGEVLLSDVLVDLGYATGMIGKWHLGAAPEFHPNQRGFHEFFGFLGGGHNYFGAATDSSEYAAPLMRNETLLQEQPGYLTEVLSEEAVGFVERHVVVPFFLFLSYNAPHAPIHEPPPQYLRRVAHIQDPERRMYAAMVSALDDGVGAVLEALSDNGLLESTLVVFLGDNGGVIASGAENRLRGQKATFYEGGIRVPFAMQWVGTLPAAVRYEHQVSSIDIFSTVVAAAGVSLPTDRAYDGVDLLPYLEAAGEGVPHQQLFWRYGEFDSGFYAVRENRMKLVRQTGGNVALYDLVSDPLESTDLSDARPEEVKRLKDAYSLWNSEMTAPAAFPAPKEVRRK